MGVAARIESLSGKLPTIAFRWDAETEILSGQFKVARKAGGLTGSVELEGSEGAFVLLDVAGGAVRGLEVVVWPEIEVVPGLTAPPVERTAQLVVPSRPSQPGVAAVEVETRIVARKSPDEATIHLMVGPRRKAETAQLADHLLVEVDGAGEIAGFWLLGVPPFPRTDADLE